MDKHHGVFTKGGEDRVAHTPADAVTLAWRGWAEKTPATAKPAGGAKQMPPVGEPAGDTDSTVGKTPKTTSK